MSQVRLTRIDPEESGGAAKVLPGERGVLQEVSDEDVVKRLRVVDGVQDDGVCRAHTESGQGGIAGSRRGDGWLTSVVDVGGNLDVALLRVDGDVVEVLVLLQGEVSPQLQAVPVLVRRVDQHGVVVVKLGGGDRWTISPDQELPGLQGHSLLGSKT